MTQEESIDDYNTIKKKYTDYMYDMNNKLKLSIDKLANREYYRKILEYTMSFNNIDDFDISDVPDIRLLERNSFNTLAKDRKDNLQYIIERIGDRLYTEDNDMAVPKYSAFYNVLDKNVNIMKNDLLSRDFKSSTDMFSAILENKLTPDIYVLDGRLQENDFPLLIKLHAENAIFLLDDFEGMEK